jgi:hypothetical protein
MPASKEHLVEMIMSLTKALNDGTLSEEKKIEVQKEIQTLSKKLTEMNELTKKNGNLLTDSPAPRKDVL